MVFWTAACGVAVGLQSYMGCGLTGVAGVARQLADKAKSAVSGGGGGGGAVSPTSCGTAASCGGWVAVSMQASGAVGNVLT